MERLSRGPVYIRLLTVIFTIDLLSPVLTVKIVTEKFLANLFCAPPPPSVSSPPDRPEPRSMSPMASASMLEVPNLPLFYLPDLFFLLSVRSTAAPFDPSASCSHQPKPTAQFEHAEDTGDSRRRTCGPGSWLTRWSMLVASLVTEATVEAEREREST
ncbi:hypothetical protein RIF29_39292 [Crotalaria pallida]|uniref:Uncharacterized protein n=1 Tax=Crotalaria pallida TaxID=3830 RepID=A0AAN9HMC5_CROPI